MYERGDNRCCTLLWLRESAFRLGWWDCCFKAKAETKKADEAIDFAVGATTDLAKSANELKRARLVSTVTDGYILKLAEVLAEQVDSMIAETRRVIDGGQKGISFGKKEAAKIMKDIQAVLRTTCVLHSCTCQLRGDNRLIVSSLRGDDRL